MMAHPLLLGRPMVTVPFSRIALCACWLLAVGAGSVVLMNYQTADGQIGDTPGQWPVDTQLPLASDRATLLLFAHPRCPCTRASISELNRLLHRSQGRVAGHVVFFQPEEFPDKWARTDLWRSAAAIPGVTVHVDQDGVEARRFGAETSGFVVLYNARGELLFNGGITAGRGHEGDNFGSRQIVSLLAGESDDSTQSPVYGCSLLGSCETTKEPESPCTP